MPPISYRRGCFINYSKEKMWEPGYLKGKCKELGLEDQFQLYQIRLWKSYLSVFYFLHILVTVSHCTLLLTTSAHVEIIYFDVGLFIGSAVIILSILSINFCDTFIANHTWMMFLSSMLAALTLVLTDLFQTFYHKTFTNWTLGSFYDTYIIFMIYMFLPIHFIFGAVALGLLISGIYIVYFLIFEGLRFTLIFSDIFHFTGLWVDILHYLCLNMVGLFFRVMNGIVVRSSFLDRHQYVKEELWLRNARIQEKLLLDSILPKAISQHLQREIQNRISLAKKGMRHFSVLDRSMTIQVHPDVSILYADVVNYTHLTTTLTVEQLVTILHDLFRRFDVAASRYQVQRIKFLGDCYYCVAGLVEPDPDHADNCVALGLCMIAEIQDLRDIQNLDINMRIGVHSGNLFAGIIGQAKLQYDVWGLDVTIANVLESTGVPGFVHISGATLSNLDLSDYVIIDGPERAVNHPLLKKYKIKTYIVESGPSSTESSDSFDYGRTLSVISITSRPFHHTRHEDASLDAVFNAELNEEFRKMPVSPYNIKDFYGNIGKNEQSKLHEKVTFFLTFRDMDLEKDYLRQTDFMFKYNILLVWMIGLSLLFVQITYGEGLCLLCASLDVFVIFSLFLFTFISWYKKVCWWRTGRRNPGHVYNRFSCFIFYVYESIQRSLLIRICIYLFVTFSNCLVVAIILFNCDRSAYILGKIESKLFRYEEKSSMCFQPWLVTNVAAIMISMAITFTRIPFLVKTLVVVVQTVTYLLLVFTVYDFNYRHSVSSNPFLAAEYAHGLLILITAVTAYLKERQIEFANKVNFSWQKELEGKERDAHITNQSIVVLLNNILPSHVVEMYLNSLAKHELYYENYQMVSVMFAMLMHFQMDLENLRILNEIITEFDILLLYYKEYFVVEKIKVVGCTYMAACGLDVSFADSISKPVKRESEEFRGSFGGNHKDLEEVVFVLASFALDMMRTLEGFKTTYKSVAAMRSHSIGAISIGISSGEVMAGIVGASQPHYDIWGNAVNMASRMQSTGLADTIQVTEESALILEEFGIKCNYRGLTYVKGRGKIPTYMVDISKEYDFTVKPQRRKPSHEQRSTILSYLPYDAVDIPNELGGDTISFSNNPKYKDYSSI